MLMPRKTKYRKMQRGSMRGISKGARKLAFGDYGLRALEPVWMTARQIEAMRVALSRRLKKEGHWFLRVFPDKPVSKKPAETRMGKGKGAVDRWVAVVKRERIICEISGVKEERAKEILKAAAHKVPMRTRFVRKDSEGES